MRNKKRDRGSATLELVIVAPIMLLILAGIVAAGRIALAQQAVQSVAYDVARAASISRDAPSARSAAQQVAALSLASNQLGCAPSTIDVTTGGFSSAVGSTAVVDATILCTVRLSDIALPGIPGSITITRAATSPIDQYRER